MFDSCRGQSEVLSHHFKSLHKTSETQQFSTIQAKFSFHITS